MNNYMTDFLVLGDFEFKTGDLVMTVLGDYGIVVGFGKHMKYGIDDSEYYYVLINNHVQYYLPFALIKIKKK